MGMKRWAAGRGRLVTMAALGAGLAASCHQPRDLGFEADGTTEATGAVELALALSAGVNLDHLNYRIAGRGLAPITGTVNLRDPGATISFMVGNIPACTGYEVGLDGASEDGKTTCTGSGTFDIVTNRATSLKLAIQCMVPDDTGAVVVCPAGVNACPVLGVVSVAPLSARVGRTITLRGAATDADPGTALVYKWAVTNGSGTVANGGAAETTFTCTEPGRPTLRFSVSDGHCEKFTDAIVSCTRE